MDFHYPDLDLLPYQSAFAANNSRFKIGLWARQTGKDHTATAEAVLDCLNNPGTTWIILAASERQAIESLIKAKEWATVLKFDIVEFTEAPPNLPLASACPTTTGIKWSNGSRLIALPANAQTIRGYSANLILTEFAFHENADEIWRAIYPSITNPLRGGPKKLRIISTPNGPNNKFAQLWKTNAPSSSSNPASLGHLGATSPWFTSKITIHDAIAGGLPLDPAELQAGLDDNEAWAQEYLCEFMDTSSVLLPYDLLAPCESTEATETFPPISNSAFPSRPSNFVMGLDFGRKHDLTVAWFLERIPAPPGIRSNFDPRTSHSFVTREVLCLKNMSTPDQLEILRPRIARCQRVCLDYTGAGVGLGDYLVQEFGEYHPNPLTSSGARPARTKIELCHFTTALKSELFPRLRTAFEQRAISIPISREIREDLHALRRVVSLNGQVTYRAPHSPDGHSDRATALALALHAARNPVVSSIPVTIHVPGRTADLRWARQRVII